MENQQSQYKIFIHLIPDQRPPVNQIPTKILLIILKTIQKISLTYPLNLIIFILVLLYLIKAVIDKISKPKKIQYYALPHFQTQGTNIATLKKEVKEIKNQMVGMERKFSRSKKQQSQINQNKREISQIQRKQIDNLNNEIEQIMNERKQLREVSSQLQNEVRKSLGQMLDTIKKIRN